MRISDWSSDVCSSDLPISITFLNAMRIDRPAFIATISVFFVAMSAMQIPLLVGWGVLTPLRLLLSVAAILPLAAGMPLGAMLARRFRSEEHTSELQSLMRISYAVFCLKKKT